MHLLDQRVLGIAILALLAALVTVKQVATGSVLDRPAGSLAAWAADVYNLIFLLVVNPLVAVLLITRRLDAVDPTNLAAEARWLTLSVEATGILLYLLGCGLMAWALLRLGRGFQAGGNAPRLADRMVVAGPYRFIRHPMYTAALCLALGLACGLGSLAALAVFCIYLLLIVILIPVEERGLRRAYGEPYRVYQRNVAALLPHLF